MFSSPIPPAIIYQVNKLFHKTGDALTVNNFMSSPLHPTWVKIENIVIAEIKINRNTHRTTKPNKKLIIIAFYPFLHFFFSVYQFTLNVNIPFKSQLTFQWLQSCILCAIYIL